MLTIHATTPRPVPSNESAGAAAHDPAGFASLLRQSQVSQPVAPTPPSAAAATPPAKPEAATNREQPGNTASATAAEPDTDAPSAHDALERGRTAARSKQRLATNGHAFRDTNRHAVTPAAGDATPPIDTRNDTAAQVAAHNAPAIDPGVLHWLAGLQRSAPASNGARAAATGTATDDASAALATTTRGAQRASIGPRDDDAKDDKPRIDADAGAGLAAAASSEPTTPKPALAALTTRDDSAESTPVAASVAPPPSMRHEAPAPIAVALATPITAPEFPRALGLQLSVFARAGIQHAELQLNPAEMGPVSVQIVMDGTQARVDFGADVAATRQAIEAGLPELASALRDAGFTLAGGGVSQHSHGRGHGDEASDRGHRRALDGDALAAGADGVPGVTRTNVRLGGLDLYA